MNPTMKYVTFQEYKGDGSDLRSFLGPAMNSNEAWATIINRAWAIVNPEGVTTMDEQEIGRMTPPEGSHKPRPVGPPPPKPEPFKPVIHTKGDLFMVSPGPGGRYEMKPLNAFLRERTVAVSGPGVSQRVVSGSIRFRLGMLLLKAAMRLWGSKAVVDGEPV